MDLVDTIQLGLNNPECAFFVGSYMGFAWGAKLLFLGYLMYIGSRVVDKLALTPLLNWAKKQIYKKKG